MRNDVPSAEANANQSITFDGQDAEIASGFLMITCAKRFLWRIEAALGAGGAESAGGSTGIPTPRHAPLRDAVPPGGTDEAEETTQVTAASSTADSFPSERVFLVEVEAHAAGVAARCVAAHERLERLAPFGASLTPRTGRY